MHESGLPRGVVHRLIAVRLPLHRICNQAMYLSAASCSSCDLAAPTVRTTPTC